MPLGRARILLIIAATTTLITGLMRLKKQYGR